MATYTTVTSDKKKKTALTLLLIGGIGLHLFYVGRIKSGLIRFFLGTLFWSLIIGGIHDLEVEMVVGGIAFLVIFNVVDLVKLLLGAFRDNVGAALRA